MHLIFFLDFICLSSLTLPSLYFRHKTAEWSSDDETKELNTAAPALTPTERVQTEGPPPAPCHSYKKSLRLSSDQIVIYCDNAYTTHDKLISLLIIHGLSTKKPPDFYHHGGKNPISPSMAK